MYATTSEIDSDIRLNWFPGRASACNYVFNVGIIQCIVFSLGKSGADPESWSGGPSSELRVLTPGVRGLTPNILGSRGAWASRPTASASGMHK